jgi:hypothetical protein
VLLPPELRRSLSDHAVIAAYVAGGISGAVVTALTTWFMSGFAEPLGGATRLVVFCAGAILVCLAKQGPLGRCVPEARRQIPAEVLAGGRARGAYRFGVELGTGVRTYAPSPAPYLLLLTLLLGHLALGTALLIAVGFGVGRGLPLLVQVSAAGRQQITTRFLLGGAPFGSNLATALVFVGGLSLV